jgi:hypothetical protein
MNNTGSQRLEYIYPLMLYLLVFIYVHYDLQYVIAEIVATHVCMLMWYVRLSLMSGRGQQLGVVFRLGRKLKA